MTAFTKNNDVRTRLRVIMAEYDLQASDVGTLLGRSTSTVQSWISAGPIDIPENMLELLKYKLKDDKGGYE